MKYFSKLILFTFLAFTVSAFVLPDAQEEKKGELKWYTWEEAIEANKKEPKKLMIDIYTGWCGWCKVMDKKTFSNPAVAKYLTENFYPIKLDAEQKEAIMFNDFKFEYKKAGKRGVHMLAYSLLDGQMSYPSIVFMDQDIKRIMISKGFKEKKDFMTELEFISDEHYKTTKFEAFKKAGK